MAAHPVRERDVVHEQGRVVATGGQPGSLSVPGDVEQADRDTVELVSRRCSDQLTRGDGVSGQQQIPTVHVKFKRAAHDHLTRLLTPSERGNARNLHHIVQLDALHPRVLVRQRSTAGRSICQRRWHRSRAKTPQHVSAADGLRALMRDETKRYGAGSVIQAVVNGPRSGEDTRLWVTE
jgi:hypothetical protein